MKIKFSILILLLHGWIASAVSIMPPAGTPCAPGQELSFWIQAAPLTNGGHYEIWESPLEFPQDTLYTNHIPVGANNWGAIEIPLTAQPCFCCIAFDTHGVQTGAPEVLTAPFVQPSVVVTVTDSLLTSTDLLHWTPSTNWTAWCATNPAGSGYFRNAPLKISTATLPPPNPFSTN